MHPTRRQLLLAGASLAVAPTLATAADAPRFVFVILRGGLDGLTAVPVPGDPAFAEARGPLGRFEAFDAAPRPLDGPFALHPLLPQLHAMHGRGELLVLHATGLPYRERSHFDAQNVLEHGGVKPHELATGWLARALPHVAGSRAVALDTAVPLVLRGAASVDTWAPSTLPSPDADLVARLSTMWQGDAALATALARARGLRDDPDMAGMSLGVMATGGGRRAAVALAGKAAEFLQRGSTVAVLELGGWDSHANQGAPNGATSNNLRTLDAAMDALRSGLQEGGTWARTVVIVATEFGRSRNRPEGAMTFGSGHDLNNGALIVSPLANGGRVLGGVDPETLMTYGFDPVTGRPEPGRHMTEAEVFSGIIQALGIETPGAGLPDMRIMRRKA